MASRIIRYLPTHHTYVEAFGGSAAVLLAKAPTPIEVYNDLDGELVNLFRILREPDQFNLLLNNCKHTLYSRAEFALASQPSSDPLESARRLIVRTRQSHSGLGRSWSYCVEDTQQGTSSAIRRWLSGIERLPRIHARLRNVQVEGDDWRKILERYDRPRTLFYLDPPYMAETRVGGGYRHEFNDADHHDLVIRLLRLKGMVILSGYPCDAYLPLEEKGWHRVDFDVPAYSSSSRNRRNESLWISPNAMMALDMPSVRSPESVNAMRQAAYRTHKTRVDATERRLIEIIASMQATGTPLSISAVARNAGVSREHLTRRYRHLLDEQTSPE